MTRLPEPGQIALNAVREAERQVGIVESGGNNRGPEVEAFLTAVGHPPGAPWCAAFIRCCIERSALMLGLDLPADLPGTVAREDFPDSAWTPDYAAWAKALGLWIPVIGALKDGGDGPMRGDLACFYFPAKGRIAHIGIVAARLGGFQPGDQIGRAHV